MSKLSTEELVKYELSVEEKLTILKKTIKALNYNESKSVKKQIKLATRLISEIEKKPDPQRVEDYFAVTNPDQNVFDRYLISEWRKPVIKKYPKVLYNANELSNTLSHYAFFTRNSARQGEEAVISKIEDVSDSEGCCGIPACIGGVIGAVGGVAKGIFNIFTRKPLNEVKQFEVFYLLSLVNNEKLKKTIIEETCQQYNSRWHIIQSDSSAELMSKLEYANDTQKKFDKIISYMRKCDGNKTYNNGKGLFNTIAQIVFNLREYIVRDNQEASSRTMPRR